MIRGVETLPLVARKEGNKDKMKRVFFLIWLLILWPCIAAAQERYVIAYAGFAGFQSPLWATKELGFLNKYGTCGKRRANAD